MRALGLLLVLAHKCARVLLDLQVDRDTLDMLKAINMSSLPGVTVQQVRCTGDGQCALGGGHGGRGHHSVECRTQLPDGVVVDWLWSREALQQTCSNCSYCISGAQPGAAGEQHKASVALAPVSTTSRIAAGVGV